MQIAHNTGGMNQSNRHKPVVWDPIFYKPKKISKELVSVAPAMYLR